MPVALLSAFNPLRGTVRSDWYMPILQMGKMKHKRLRDLLEVITLVSGKARIQIQTACL